MIVNKSQLADIFGVSQGTLSEWQKDGMPFEKGASARAGNTYDTARCISWRQEAISQGDGYDLNKERARLAKEQADAKEMENAKARAELLPAEDVEEIWGGQCTRIKNKLLAMAPKVAPLMVGIKTPTEAEEIINTVVYEALNELSRTPDA